MPTVQPITSKSQYSELLASGKLFFIDFHAVWCGPCKVISPIFENLAKAAPGGVEFYKLDVDEVPDVAEECEIRAMPTFQAFKGGQRVGSFVGAHPAGLTNLVNTSIGQL